MIRQKLIAFRWMLAGIGLLGGTVAADGAERPPFAPTRDVAVVYQVEATQAPAGQAGGQAGGQTVKMSYSAASGRLRIEQPSMPGYMLIDRASGRMTMVMDQMRSFMDMPFDAKAGAGLLLNDKMTFSRAGADRVAGMACTVWNVTSDKATARLCIAEDGVILRGTGSDPKHGEGKLLATSVSYASQPAAIFSPPPGFLRMEMPAMPPNLGGKPGKPPG